MVMMVMVVVVMMVVVMMVMIIVVVVMVVVSKFDVWIRHVPSGLAGSGSSGVRSSQEGECIRDGIKKLGIRPCRLHPVRIGQYLCRRLRTVERREARDHSNHTNKLLVHLLLLGALNASAQRPIIDKPVLSRIR
jgi:hypothetical protein